MDREDIKRLARLGFCCAAAGAFVLAMAPGNPEIFSYDKYNHMLAFASITVLARLGWSRSQSWVIAAALVAFGGLIELCQALPFVHRDASWGDLLADSIAVAGGMVVGSLALLAIRRSLAGPATSW